MVRGIVVKKVTSDVSIHGYAHNASKEEPQYLIQSDKTDYVAIHKAGALALIDRGSNRGFESAHNRQ